MFEEFSDRETVLSSVKEVIVSIFDDVEDDHMVLDFASKDLSVICYSLPEDNLMNMPEGALPALSGRLADIDPEYRIKRRTNYDRGPGELRGQLVICKAESELAMILKMRPEITEVIDAFREIAKPLAQADLDLDPESDPWICIEPMIEGEDGDIMGMFSLEFNLDNIDDDDYMRENVYASGMWAYKLEAAESGTNLFMVSILVEDIEGNGNRVLSENNWKLLSDLEKRFPDYAFDSPNPWDLN